MLRKRLFCDICIKSRVNKDSKFVAEGSDSYRRNGIKKHDVFEQHDYAVDVIKSRAQKRGNTTAGKAFKSLKEVDKHRVAALFRTCQALAKKARPFTGYVWMCQLDERKEVQFTHQYHTDKYAREITYFIAISLTEKIW